MSFMIYGIVGPLLKSKSFPRASFRIKCGMRKKSSGTRTIFWWVVWITLTIASFFVAAAFWTPFIAKKFGSIHETRNSVIWIVAVFGTWMAALVPLIIMMYSKVDKAYEDARLRREKSALRFKSIPVDKSKRLLPSGLAAKLEHSPEAIQGGHLVTLLLKDGRRVPNVFIAGKTEILGIYDAEELNFEAGDIREIELSDLNTLPPFLTSHWLRLDGVTAPE